MVTFAFKSSLSLVLVRTIILIENNISSASLHYKLQDRIMPNEAMWKDSQAMLSKWMKSHHMQILCWDSFLCKLHAKLIRWSPQCSKPPSSSSSGIQGETTHLDTGCGYLCVRLRSLRSHSSHRKPPCNRYTSRRCQSNQMCCCCMQVSSLQEDVNNIYFSFDSTETGPFYLTNIIPFNLTCVCPPPLMHFRKTVLLLQFTTDLVSSFSIGP